LIKENISKDLILNNKLSTLHNLTYDLGFNLRSNNLVSYKSHNKIFTVNVNKKEKTIALINHFSSRNQMTNSWRNLTKNKTKKKYFKMLYQSHIRKAKKNNIAMYQHGSSRTILLDIDCHTTNLPKNLLKLTVLNFVEEMKTVFNNPEFNPGLIEISRLGRGIHIYFQVNEMFKSDRTEYFLKNFKKYFEDCNPSMKLEWRDLKKAVRLPFTSDYSQYRYWKGNLVRTSFKSLSKIETVELNLEIANKVLESLYGKEKKLIFYKDKSFIAQTIDFSMYLGDRVEKHLALARYCFSRGMSYESFVSESIYWNKGSKDLTYSLQRTCRSVWNSVKRYRGIEFKSETNSFISNYNRVDSKLQSKIERKINILSKDLTHKNQENIKNELLIFSIELFGNMLFQKEKPRKIFKNAKLTKKKREEMLIGYQFPIPLQEEIIQNYSLKSCRKTLFKHFINLFLVQYKHNSQGWSEGCCRQFREREEWNKNISKYYMEWFPSLNFPFSNFFVEKSYSKQLHMYGLPKFDYH